MYSVVCDKQPLVTTHPRGIVSANDFGENWINVAKNLPLNLVALVPSTDANFAIDSLVFLSSCVRDAAANFVSMLYVQHVPDDGTTQCLKTASAIKM